jgi:hypothetical protein
MIKSKEVIQKIKQLESGVKIIPKLFIPSELEYIKSLFTDSPKKSKNGNKFNSIADLSDIDAFYGFMQEKLNLFFKNWKLESAHYCILNDAYTTHSDTGKNNLISYKQFMIPMSINPPGDAYLIIYNQRVYHSSTFLCGMDDQSYIPFYNIGCWDPSYYDGWDPNLPLIDQEIAIKLWGTQWKRMQDIHKGFSIKAVYKYKIGDLVLFDRTLLHGSGFIAENNIEYKTCVVGLTYYDEA